MLDSNSEQYKDLTEFDGSSRSINPQRLGGNPIKVIFVLKKFLMVRYLNLDHNIKMKSRTLMKLHLKTKFLFIGLALAFTLLALPFIHCIESLILSPFH